MTRPREFAVGARWIRGATYPAGRSDPLYDL
jgi:hypothetical protein